MRRGSSAPADRSEPESRSVHFVGARMVGDGGRPSEVLVRNGRIAAIGADLAAGDGDLAGSERIDLGGRYLGPGLWDHHVHFTQWSLKRQRIDLSGATSAADAARLVAEHVLRSDAEAGSLVVGYGFRDALWADLPSRALLDAAGGRHPVVLVSADIHCVWVNALALRRFGIAGDDSGVLREQPAFDVNTTVSRVDDGTLDGWAREAATAAAARGVVGIVELEMAPNLEVWSRRVAAGIRLRVRCGVYLDQLDDAIARGMRTGDVLPGTSGLVTLGPFKIITDGSLNTRTAYCHDPYASPASDSSGGPSADAPPEDAPVYGSSAYAFDELVGYLRKAARHGIVPAVHAIGDRANRLALDAFEAVGCGGSIEHAQLVAREDLARFRSLGVIASVQPEHAMDDRDVADRLWAGRTDRAFPLESLLESGARLQLGSDAPVAPLDPWVSMAAAISRARDGREPWHPEQRIAQSAAYRASTAEDRLRIGADADLVITELDPLTASDEQLRAMPVAGTMVAGEWTHNRL